MSAAAHTMEMINIRYNKSSKVKKEKSKPKAVNSKMVLVLSIVDGLVSLVTGVMLVLHGLRSDNYGGIFSLLGTGIWCSVIFIFFGILGLCKGRNKVLDIFTVTLSVLCFILSIVLIAISVLSLQTSNYTFTQDMGHWWRVNTVLLVMQMVVGVLEMVLVSAWWRWGKL